MKQRTQVAEAITQHGTGREALVPVLQAVNSEMGYLSLDVLAEVSRELRLPPSEVHGVASFYGMFSLLPLGQHVVQVCESAPCHVSGGCTLLSALRDALSLGAGQTSADGTWTLQTVSCLGQCDGGPTMLVDGELHRNVAPEQVATLLAQYEGDES